MDQLELFDKNYFSINKKIRLIELFSGYNSQQMAMRNIGADFESWKTSEWQVASTISSKAIFHADDNTDYSIDMTDDEVMEKLVSMGISIDDEKPVSLADVKRKGIKWCRTTYNTFKACHNLGSITNFHGKDLEIVDKDKYCYFMFYSFCCLTNDSLILSKKGYIPLKDLQVGDEVLTKSNTWHKVAKKFSNGICPTYFVDAMGFENIHCTPNHKFLVRTMKRVGHFQKRSFSEPDYKEVQNITKNDYFGMPVIMEEKPFYTDDLDFWFIIGMYLGDGHLEASGNGISLACNEKKLNLLKSKLDYDKWKWTSGKSSTCYYFRFSNKDVKDFIIKYIGQYSDKKLIPYEILCLPKDQLQAFYEGYLNSDGCIINGKHQFSSINRALIYSISAIINKLYHRPTCIYKVETKPTTVIQGRVVNQQNWYQLRFNPTVKKQDHAFYEDGYIWYPFNKIVKGEIEPVYNIEVEDDHSYIVQGCISKNCQDLSNAGKQAGMKKGSGTRSGLLWEVERLLTECKEHNGNLPDVLCLENVPQLISEKNMPDFTLWLEFLRSLGYSNHYQILNAKDFGVPQNRERCFMFSFLGEYDYDFPTEIPLQYRLKDVLEEEVDEKYYINSEKADKLIEDLLNRNVLPISEERGEA